MHYVKPADLKTLTFRQKFGRGNRKLALAWSRGKLNKIGKNRIYFCELIVTKSILELLVLINDFMFTLQVSTLSFRSQY